MDLNALKKGLFSVKETPKVESAIDKDAKPSNEVERVIRGENYYVNEGYMSADRCGGRIQGFTVSLDKVYLKIENEVRNDEVEQEKITRPYKLKVGELNAEINEINSSIDRIKMNNISKTESKIAAWKDDISHYRKNPHEITGHDSSRGAYYIGTVILAFLTVYLFVFYSSATYSTFFKEFTLNEIGVAKSIFDPNALSKAYHDGFTELILLLTIPFVFLGLGYLINKFEESKDRGRYFKIALLILVTFIFDSILAYEITEKIYNIKKENSFNGMPEFIIKMAFESVNFWLIIFAGFVVYLIWGFVYGFVIKAHSNLDTFKVAIREKEKQIADAECELKKFDLEINELERVLGEKKVELEKNKGLSWGLVFRWQHVEHLYSFTHGWMNWMKEYNCTATSFDEIETTTREFVSKIRKDFKPENN